MNNKSEQMRQNVEAIARRELEGKPVNTAQKRTSELPSHNPSNKTGAPVAGVFKTAASTTTNINNIPRNGAAAATANNTGVKKSQTTTSKPTTPSVTAKVPEQNMKKRPASVVQTPIVLDDYEEEKTQSSQTTSKRRRLSKIKDNEAEEAEESEEEELTEEEKKAEARGICVENESDNNNGIRTEQDIKDKFKFYVAKHAIRAIISDVDKYIEALDCPNDDLAEFIVNTRNHAQIIETKNKINITKVILTLESNSPDFRPLLHILSQCVSFKFTEIVPGQDGKMSSRISTVTKNPIPESEVAYDITLNYDPRKFRKASKSLIGDDKAHQLKKFPTEPAKFILTASETEIASTIYALMTFGDYIELNVLAFRDIHCQTYLEKYYNGEPMSLKDECLALLDCLLDSNKDKDVDGDGDESGLSDHEIDERRQSKLKARSENIQVKLTPGEELIENLYKEYKEILTMVLRIIHFWK